MSIVSINPPAQYTQEHYNRVWTAVLQFRSAVCHACFPAAAAAAAAAATTINTSGYILCTCQLRPASSNVTVAVLYEPQQNKRPHTRLYPDPLTAVLPLVATFGSRPRQFSGLSDSSQLLIADGEIIFSGSIPGPRTFPPSCSFIFGFGFRACFFCAHREVKAQTNLR